MDDVIANSPYKLGVVSIEGNKATREDLILRQLKSVREAQTFGEIHGAVADGIQRLKKLGIFDEVNCTLDTGNAEGKVDLSVQLTERKQSSLTAETLFTAGKASMEITGKHSNLFGNAETYSLTASVGSLFGSNWGAPAADMTGSLTMPEPFGWNDVTGNMKIYQSYADNNALYGYTQQARGVSFGLMRQWLDAHHDLRLNLVDRQLSTPDNCHLDGGLFWTWKTSLKHTMTFDGRSKEVLPKSGSAVRFSNEIALPVSQSAHGAYGFRKHMVEAKFNSPIGESCFLQCGMNAGLIQSMFTDSRTLFANDKFYSGGPLPVRGLTMGGLGPRSARGEAQISTGGDALLTMNANMLCPIPGGWLKKMNGHLQMFANAGSIVNTSQMSEEGTVGTMFKQLQHACGFGLVFPFAEGAKLELNYCVHPEASTNRENIQIGMAVDWLG